MNINKLLFEESPLSIQPTAAVCFGTESAIILQQIHYWLINKIKFNDEKSFINGFYWVWRTYEEWEDDFPFMDDRTIQRRILDLEKSGVLISDQLRLKAGDARKYYRIDYERLEKVSDELYQLKMKEKADRKAARAARKAEKKNGSPINETSRSGERDVETNQAETAVDVLFGNGREVKNPGAYNALISGIVENSRNKKNGKVDVSEYPEDVREVIRVFCETFMIRPPGKIRGKGGDFALWINDARSLRKAIGDFGVEAAIKSVHSNWIRSTSENGGVPPYTIARPGAIIKAAISTISAIRSGAGTAVSPVSPVSVDDAKERIRRGREAAGQSAPVKSAGVAAAVG